MKVLALDTSCMMGSVAIVEDDKVIIEQMLNIKVTHSERLIPSIESILQSSDLNLDAIEGFAVAIGPGSFTGLRIGLAAVKGLAFALDKPVVGVSSLEALAYNAFGVEGPVASVLDARRGEFYIGVYDFDGLSLSTILDDTVLPPEELINYLTSLGKKIIFVGDGVYSLRNLVEERLGSNGVVPPPGMIHPRASNIGWLALKKMKTGDVDDLAALKPNYIRTSDAEKKC